MRLIPAIDLMDGSCVRLLKGEFDQQTVYPLPVEQLAAQYGALGSEWLHVVDLDAARGLGSDNYTLIASLTKVKGIKLQVGGGIRDASKAAALLNSGVARLVIGSLAVNEPEQAIRWLHQQGPDRIVLGLDVRIEAGTPRLATHGWQQQTQLSLWEVLERFVDSGLKHVLCTDISRDGGLTGPNLELYTEAVKRYPMLDWQASGGIRDVSDLQALDAVSVASAISGRALLEGRIDNEELRPFLPVE